MSGGFGIGLRIHADRKDLFPGGFTGGFEQYEHYNVATLVNQIKTVKNVRWVIINLSQGAFGDIYLAPHSVLSNITPAAIPNGARDLFGELLDAFNAADIKVIAYAAGQGPAMLKHGAQRAFDRVPTGCTGLSCTSQAMDNWKAWVRENYGIEDITSTIYKTAYANDIIKEFAKRYKKKLAGWWFDQGPDTNIPLLKEVVTEQNPCAVFAVNDGQKVPLKNNNPGIEDITSGSPRPVANCRNTPPVDCASDDVNLPMVTSIEQNTEDGYFVVNAEDKSLGHMFLPLQQVWNTGNIVWSQEQAAEWQQRVTDAKGAWTWNVQSDDAFSRVNLTKLEFLRELQETIDPSS